MKNIRKRLAVGLAVVLLCCMVVYLFYRSGLVPKEGIEQGADGNEEISAGQLNEGGSSTAGGRAEPTETTPKSDDVFTRSEERYDRAMYGDLVVSGIVTDSNGHRLQDVDVGVYGDMRGMGPEPGLIRVKDGAFAFTFYNVSSVRLSFSRAGFSAEERLFKTVDTVTLGRLAGRRIISDVVVKLDRGAADMLRPFSTTVGVDVKDRLLYYLTFVDLDDQDNPLAVRRWVTGLPLDPGKIGPHCIYALPTLDAAGNFLVEDGAAPVAGGVGEERLRGLKLVMSSAEDGFLIHVPSGNEGALDNYSRDMLATMKEAPVDGYAREVAVDLSRQIGYYYFRWNGHYGRMAVGTVWALHVRAQSSLDFGVTGDLLIGEGREFTKDAPPGAYATGDPPQVTRLERGVSILAAQEKAVAAEAAVAAPVKWLEAVRGGDVPRVKGFIVRGQDVNARELDSGQTALLVATEKEDLAMTEFLLKAGARPDEADLMRMTPLLVAIRANREDIVQVLFAHGASANIPSIRGEMALAVACENGNLSLVKSLLAHGAKPDSPDLLVGMSSLMIAARRGDAEIVDCLLAAGANVRVATRDGTQALHVAAASGNAEIVSALLKAKADPNARAELDETPLTLAVRTGKAEVVKLLLDAGADVDTRTAVGQSALLLAERGKFAEVAALLKARGATPTDRPLPVSQATVNSEAGALHALEGAIAAWRTEKQRGTTDVPTFQEVEPYLPEDHPLRGRQGNDLMGYPIQMGSIDTGVRMSPKSRAILRPVFESDEEEAEFWGHFIWPPDGPPRTH